VFPDDLLQRARSRAEGPASCGLFVDNVCLRPATNRQPATGFGKNPSEFCSAAQQTSPWGLALARFGLHLPRTRMNRTHKKKSGKPLKLSQHPASLGIPTNIAVGPLGFRAELDVDPTGEESCFYHDLAADRPDLSTATLDANNPGPSRVVFRDKTSGNQDLHVPETLTTGGMIDRAAERRNDLTGGCF